MTENTNGVDRAGGLVLCRTRLFVMTLGVAVAIAGTGCMAVSTRHGWRAYVAYWGAPMMPVPVTDAARTWFLASMLGVVVGVAVAITAAAPRRAAVAAMTAGAIAAALVLVLTALS
jgi:hypothetical protein